MYVSRLLRRTEEIGFSLSPPFPAARCTFFSCFGEMEIFLSCSNSDLRVWLAREFSLFAELFYSLFSTCFSEAQIASMPFTTPFKSCLILFSYHPLLAGLRPLHSLLDFRMQAHIILMSQL